MIGVYNYTVVLTYLSLLSASLGITITLSGGGCPYLGIFFLLFCGFCDAFDGKVACTKKDRSKIEKRFGIQIDSLSDLVAFGVLPACIGVAIFRTSPFIQSLLLQNVVLGMFLRILVYAILLLYVLNALIRLAYFNVSEEDRQTIEEGARKTYTGLPVTSAAILFPLVMMFQYLTPFDLSFLYYVVLFCMALLFVLKIHLKKLGMKEILFFVFLGVIEFVILLFVKFL